MEIGDKVLMAGKEAEVIGKEREELVTDIEGYISKVMLTVFHIKDLESEDVKVVKIRDGA